MPYTVNGIGTTYYGQRNLRLHHGQCEFCHREVELKEYETTHWFVVFFVPVIPLGRKKIIDDCPVCRQHRVLPLAKWDELREHSVEEKTEAFVNNQDDPRAALELLETLSTFRQLDEADKLAQGMQDRFDDDPDVQVWMGEWHELRRRPAEAAKCYRHAHALDPANLAAKRAVAALMMEEGQPEQARAFIESAPKIDPQADPGLYVALAQSYQRLGQHSDALVAFHQVLEAAPALNADKGFRKLVRASEKCDPAGTKVLRRNPIWSTGGVVVGTAALGIVALTLFANYYIATHRTLHVVNGFDMPVKVALDDRPAITISPHSWQAASIAEGRHTAAVTAGGKPLATDEFDVESGYWLRWFDDPVFVLNAGGGATIVWEQAVYASPPVEGGSARVEAGTRFVAFDDVDFPFAEFPPTVNLPDGKPVTRTRVGLATFPVEQVFLLEQDVAPEAKLGLAETHLELAPGNKPLLQAYLNAAAGFGQFPRALSFLEAGLDATPVRIEWHRYMQQLATSEEQTESFRRRYRESLEKDPNNAAVLYLMARLEPRSSKAVEYLDAAIAADPKNPYPWYAKGYHRCAAGDFAAARAAYEKALALRPDDEDFRDGLRGARLALGEMIELEREARTRVEQEPYSLGWHIELLEVLTAADKLGPAMTANTNYIESLQELTDAADQVEQAVEAANITYWYLDRSFRKILASTDRSSEDSAFLRYQCYLELGQIDDAAKDLESLGSPTDPFNALQLSIGYRMAGDVAKSDEWRDRAIEQFEQGPAEHRQLGSMLRDPAGVTSTQSTDIALTPPEKAIVLIALAQSAPMHKVQFLDLAERLNFSWLFPHHFIARAIAETRSLN